jgi:hypothetical protein
MVQGSVINLAGPPLAFYTLKIIYEFFVIEYLYFSSWYSLLPPFASLNDPPWCYGCLRLLNWLTELQMDKVDKFLYLYLILLEK